MAIEKSCSYPSGRVDPNSFLNFPTQPSWYDHCGFVYFFFGSQGSGIRFMHRKPWGLITWTPFFRELFLRCTIFSRRGWSAGGRRRYCWWKRTPAPNNGICAISNWLAGFLPSTVSCEASIKSINWGPLQLPCLLGQRSRFIPWLDP